MSAGLLERLRLNLVEQFGCTEDWSKFAPGTPFLRVSTDDSDPEEMANSIEILFLDEQGSTDALFLNWYSGETRDVVGLTIGLLPHQRPLTRADQLLQAMSVFLNEPQQYTGQPPKFVLELDLEADALFALVGIIMHFARRRSA